jgi:hypothetical protein
MSRAITCKQCGFLATIELRGGRLASLSPDQVRMRQRCRKARQPDFAYDCADLASALVTTLESEARFSLTPLGQKVAARRGCARKSERGIGGTLREPTAQTSQLESQLNRSIRNRALEYRVGFHDPRKPPRD